MKKTVQAKIQWLRKQDGGREPPPPIDAFYATLSRFDALKDEWPHRSWSLVVDFLQPFDETLSTIAEVTFLSPKAPFELLQAGNTFDLFAGMRLVAHGSVLP